MIDTMNGGNYRFYYRSDSEEQTTGIYHVPVAFEGRILPGIWARIGRYGDSRVYVVAPFPRERDEQKLNYRASQYLRDAGLILPVESVGYPEVTQDLCTLTKRYSDVDLAPRRQMLNSIFSAAAAMKIEHKRWQNERSGLTEWSKKGIPIEIEFLLHQFVGPTPNWSTWISDIAH